MIMTLQLQYWKSKTKHTICTMYLVLKTFSIGLCLRTNKILVIVKCPIMIITIFIVICTIQTSGGMC